MSASGSPFFSVVIPLYNKEAFIGKTLEAVLAQEFTDFQIIIVNDGSTDGSLEVLNRFNDDRIQICHQDNQGVSAARNKGIDLSTGEYICFLDADDVWSPDFLKTIHSLIIKYPEYYVFSAAVEMEAFGKVLPAQYSVSNEVEKGVFIENYFRASRGFSVLWTSASVFHKSVFHRVGVFNVAIKSGQDTDLWMRIGEYYDVVFTTKILAKYTEHGASLSRNRQLKKTAKQQYHKFAELEKKNPDAKIFLDLNRYSEILSLKLHGNYAEAQRLKKEISMKNLPPKKRIIVHLPAEILQFLVKIQPLLIKLGIRKTYFK